MADLYVKSLNMINPFVVASSPATQGARNVDVYKRQDLFLEKLQEHCEKPVIE